MRTNCSHFLLFVKLWGLARAKVHWELLFLKEQKHSLLAVSPQTFSFVTILKATKRTTRQLSIPNSYVHLLCKASVLHGQLVSIFLPFFLASIPVFWMFFTQTRPQEAASVVLFPVSSVYCQLQHEHLFVLVSETKINWKRGWTYLKCVWFFACLIVEFDESETSTFCENFHKF